MQNNLNYVNQRSRNSLGASAHAIRTSKGLSAMFKATKLVLSVVADVAYTASISALIAVLAVTMPIVGLACTAIAAYYSYTKFYAAATVPLTKILNPSIQVPLDDQTNLSNQVNVPHDVPSPANVIRVPNDDAIRMWSSETGKGLLSASISAFNTANYYVDYTGLKSNAVQVVLSVSPYTAAAGATLMGLSAASYAYKSAPSLQQSKDFVHRQWALSSNLVTNYTPSFASRAAQSTKIRLAQGAQAVCQNLADICARHAGPQA